MPDDTQSNATSDDLDLPAIELPPAAPPDKNESKLSKLWTWLKTHKKLSIPFAVILVLVILAAVPWSRYKVAGLVLKKDFTLRVIDATTSKPVSGAMVAVGSIKAQTDGQGQVHLQVKVGKQNFIISKKYYQAETESSFVPILKQKATPSFSLQATGRQVNINVSDLLTKKNLANVDIEVGGVSAKTDSNGQALLVLPAGISQQQASLSLDGYNDAKAVVNVSDQTTAQNNLTLTPSGKTYFLSNRTGSLNIMKANLDGTDSETVLAGTATEKVDSTSLTQSPDGKYVVLEARRDSADKVPQLYVMATADDQPYKFDSGDSNFSIIGWAGDNIVYTAAGNTMADWQTGKQKIKSYNATTGKTTVLDQSAGTDATTDEGQTYGDLYVTPDKVIYSKSWSAGNGGGTTSRNNTVEQVNVDGTNHKLVASYNAASNSINIYQYSSTSFYIAVDDFSGSQDATTFYDFTPGGNFKKVTDVSPDQVYSYVVYYYSMSGKALWTETRDGRAAAITTDSQGDNQKTVAAGYNAFGWLSDNYILLDKGGSQLYIVSSSGGTPVKISDYQASAVY